MSHVIDVDIPSLHAVADRVEAAGAGIAQLPVPAGPAHWAALERTRAAWIRYLTELGEAVCSTGIDLRAVADGYARAEESARDELRRWAR